MSEMKILTVCGLGFGTSLILKMTVNKVLTQEGLRADVVHTDFGTAKSVAADLYLVSSDMAQSFEEMGKNFAPIKSVYDVEEVRKVLVPLVQKFYEEHPE